jgi:hypothetical protein
MTKEEELLAFLHEHVFDPIPGAVQRSMVTAMNQLPQAVVFPNRR